MSSHMERHSRVAHVSVTRRDPDGMMHTEISITETSTDACFDVDSCCDERERVLIKAIRDYLRPRRAPESLVRRLRRMIDEAGEDVSDNSGEDDDTERRVDGGHS